MSGGSLIGGVATAGVSDTGGHIQSITYTVTNAELSQSYTLAQGATTPFSDPVTHNLGVGGGNHDSLTWYWDTTVGNHTASVLVTYTDGSTANLSRTIAVAQPTVNAFNVTVAAAKLAPYQNWTNGQVTLNSPGIQYTATVTAPANSEGGMFGILQKVNDNITITNNVPHVFNTGWVLDNQGTAGYFWLVQNQTFNVATGTTVSTPALNGNPPPPQDNAPAFHAVQSPNSGPCTAYTGSIQFQDYLVFQPTGGIWVELSQSASYSMNGNATWNAGQNQFVGTASISTPNPATTPTLGFVSWNGYASNGSYNPIYT